jgi:hypothetical protein
MIGELSATHDMEDIVVGIFDTILQYDSGKLSQDLALKKGLNIIEGLKGLDESIYQEIRRDLINTIKGKS